VQEFSLSLLHVHHDVSFPALSCPPYHDELKPWQKWIFLPLSCFSQVFLTATESLTNRMSFIKPRTFPSILYCMFFNHEGIFNFICFFCVSDDNVTFILYSFDVLLSWFSEVKLTLHFYNKSNLVMMYNPFYAFSGSNLLVFCWGSFHLYSNNVL
jgi:hypothetical protein